jgi:hypothetical protein
MPVYHDMPPNYTNNNVVAISPTSCDHSVGIVRLRTKCHGVNVMLLQNVMSLIVRQSKCINDCNVHTIYRQHITTAISNTDLQNFSQGVDPYGANNRVSNYGAGN